MAQPIVDTGRGKYFFGRNGAGDGDITVQLSNFDINGSKVKEDHKAILRLTVIEILKAGGSIAIVGHASTTGSADRDKVLGFERVDAVLGFLRAEAGTQFVANQLDSRGKTTALAVTGKNNNEDPEWRTVWIRVWTNDTPPPSVGQLPIGAGVPLPVDPGLSKASDAINLAGGVLGVVDLGIDMAGLAAAGTVTGVGGLFLSSIAGIIGMQALWASVDKLAEFNGKMQGYADAMQDMAEAFQDAALDKKPVRNWPAIPKPEPHLSGNAPTSIAQGFWNQGQRFGCNEAYIDVLKVEADPIEVTVPGIPRKVRVNGKAMLRSTWINEKGKVREAVYDAVNKKLAAAGKSPWPTGSSVGLLGHFEKAQ